jgi:hypothetical protein
VIEQLANAVTFRAFFVASKLGATGLAVTVDVRNPAGTLIVTGGSATEVGGGLYAYTLASGSVTTEGEYTAVFKTATTTVDQQHIAALWVVGRAGVENLDAAVSTRLASGSYTAPPSAISISAQVWTYGTRELTSYADAAAAVWAYVTRTLTSAVSGTSAADVWAYATRTLTQSAVTNDDENAPGTISRRRGDTWSITITALRDFTDYTHLWLTIKTDAGLVDSASTLQVVVGSGFAETGLIYINGAAPSGSLSSASASITVNSSTSITVTVADTATATIRPRSDYVYDVQATVGGLTTTVGDTSAFIVTPDVTRAVA